MHLPTLETARLRLRPITRSDRDALYAIFSDDEVMRYWNSAALRAPAEIEAMIERTLAGYAAGTLLQLGIEQQGQPGLIGTCTMFSYHVPSRRAEIGYALARTAWGRGFMHEALGCFVGYLFEEMDLNRLEADIDPANRASGRLLERIGFRQEGFCPQRWIVAGQFSDSVLYGLLKQDWRKPSHG